MTRTSIVLVLALGASQAQAACYADYKAKRDDPLQLHYGVVQLSDAACGDTGRARDEARQKLASGGWQLLTLLGTFGQDGLAQRRSDAGQFFLRY